MNSIEIREVRREDFTHMRNIYAATKNRRRSEEFDYWCLFDSPWGDSVAIIALDSDLCVGLFILRPTLFNIGGEDIMGAQATDLMSHPEYRRRGLFVALFEESFKIASSRGWELIYAFPNKEGKSYPGFIHRLNLDHVGDVFSWNYDIQSFRLALPTWRLSKRALNVTSQDDIKLEDIEVLINTSKYESNMCQIKRDSKWLTWRYAKASRETYRWYTARNSTGEIKAAILVGERDDSWGGFGKGVLRIHEAFMQSEDDLATLLQSLIDRARDESKIAVKMFVKDENIESALRKVKFVCSESLALVVRRLTTRTLKGNIHHYPTWRIVGGDIDAF